MRYRMTAQNFCSGDEDRPALVARNSDRHCA
jgi:hypothetical protein